MRKIVKPKKGKVHMTVSKQWQLAGSAAERYQTILTPSILGPFAKALVEFSDLRAGERVVDIGCGTGSASRYAAEITGSSGKVTGIDVNPGMITVAQSLPVAQGAPIEWRTTDVAVLPLADKSVDVVLCAQSLQFLPEKEAGLSEMQRVLRADGRVNLSLWCQISENPYFETLVNALDKHIGPATAAGLQSAFSLTETEEIHNLLSGAGFGQIEMTVTKLNLPFPDLADFVPRHISATPMADSFSQAPAAVQQDIIREVAEKMNRYAANGLVTIPFKSHMIRAKK